MFPEPLDKIAPTRGQIFCWAKEIVVVAGKTLDDLWNYTRASFELALAAAGITPCDVDFKNRFAQVDAEIAAVDADERRHSHELKTTGGKLAPALRTAAKTLAIAGFINILSSPSLWLWRFDPCFCCQVDFSA